MSHGVEEDEGNKRNKKKLLGNLKSLEKVLKDGLGSLFYRYKHVQEVTL